LIKNSQPFGKNARKPQGGFFGLTLYKCTKKMPLEIPENKPMQKFLAGLLKNVEDNFSTLNSEVLSFWQCNFHICQLSFEIMFALSE